MSQNNHKTAYIPLLLGGDLNLYGMARSFYELRGEPVRVIASGQLAPTKYTKLLNMEIIPGFDQDPLFIETLRKVAKEYEESDVPVVLLGMGDWYTGLISKHLDELSQYFICPYIASDLAEELEDKEKFYELCEAKGLAYPKTTILTKALFDQGEIVQPYDYPVILKSANSISWKEFDLPGKEKVYFIYDEAAFQHTLKEIYSRNYQDNMILQDFIPDSEGDTLVLNAYVDRHHQVKMMCLGRPLLGDPAPESIGNYLAIMPDYNEDLYQQVAHFLEGLNYTGFANFDIKYDCRDGSYRFFEINLRQGRSSFYVTLNGCNLAEWPVRDYVFDDLKDQAPVYWKPAPENEMMWLGVSKSAFKKYAPESKYKQHALDLIQQGKWGTTFYYDGDKNVKRYALMQWMFHRYNQSFQKYLGKK